MYKPHLVINRRNKYAETPGKKKQESNHVHERRIMIERPNDPPSGYTLSELFPFSCLDPSAAVVFYTPGVKVYSKAAR
jgi:hypothetical protein